MSKSLSTNATHYAALTLTARLASQQGETERARRYQRWADDLKQAINRTFWREDKKMYASLTHTHMDMDNPDLTGPVINSQRQLWSVGGYLGMVTETLFGYHLNDRGFTIQPFVTAQAHHWMGSMAEDGADSAAVSNRFTLSDLNYRGKKITVILELPEYIEGSQGYYSVSAITLNGEPVSGTIDEGRLSAANTVVVQMGALQEGYTDITRVDPAISPLDVSNQQVFAPVEPAINSVTPVAEGIAVTVEDDKNSETGVIYNIYRDGVRVASAIDISQPWLDREVTREQGYCYSAEAVYTASGNQSHRAKPVCSGAVQFFGVSQLEHSGTVSAADEHINAEHIKGWGSQQDQLILTNLQVQKTGPYDITVRYSNSHHAINLGITNGVKQIKVFRGGEADPVAEGIVQMPHVLPEGELHPLKDSTPLAVTLQAGTQYRVEVVDYFNMSYLESNATYNDAGGEQPVNTVEVSGITVLDR